MAHIERAITPAVGWIVRKHATKARLGRVAGAQTVGVLGVDQAVPVAIETVSARGLEAGAEHRTALARSATISALAEVDLRRPTRVARHSIEAQAQIVGHRRISTRCRIRSSRGIVATSAAADEKQSERAQSSKRVPAEMDPSFAANALGGAGPSLAGLVHGNAVHEPNELVCSNIRAYGATVVPVLVTRT